MKQLNKIQNAIFLAGGLLMVAGAAMTLFRLSLSAWVFLLGAMMFASMQMLQRYDGPNFVIRRLRRLMLLSDVLFLVSGLLMVYAALENPFHLDHITYVQYVGNNWVAILLVAAVLQVFTVHRIGHELEKE